MSGGIIVLAEQWQGKLVDITYEMVGLGRKTADALKVPLHVAVLGSQASALAATLGAANSVVVVEDPRLDMPVPATMAVTVQALAEQKHATLIMLGGTNISMGTGAILAARSGLPFVNFCRGLRLEDGSVIATSQLYGGKILCDVRLAEAKGILCIAPGNFPGEAGRSEKEASLEKADIPLEGPPISFRSYIEPEAGDVDITAKDVLVAVGRGIQSQDNLPLAEQLAQLVDGAVAASRPVVDQGWLPMTRQVGKSGMIVKPKLYLALGISGAPEHLEGMRNSQMIVAVNTDPKAPIFDIAQYGIAMDALEFIPALIGKLQERGASQ